MNTPPSLPLHDAGQLLRLLDALPDALVVTDTAGVIRCWNAAAERLFGFGAAEAIGVGLDDILVPERFRRAHDEGFARAVASGELRTGHRVLRTRSQHKDGRKLYVDFTFALWKDPDGKVVGVCASARDATEHHLQQAAAAAAKPPGAAP
jgi:PAS domain S-box-containing protein